MNVVEFVKEQHRQADQIFTRFEKARRKEEKQKIFEELCKLLTGHDAMEREIFYPACEKAVGKIDRLMEGVVEHGLVEFSLFRADRARDDENFEYFVDVLREIWDNHVKEEEEQVLPVVARRMDQQQMDRLGDAMQARFEEVQEEDVRELLRYNLQQVLAGRAKTAPPPKKAVAKRPARAKAAAKRPARAKTARAGVGRKRTARGKTGGGRTKRTTRRAQRR